MPHVVDLIAAALCAAVSDPDAPETPQNTIDGVCCLTGEVTSCVPRAEVIGKSFTNQDILAAPKSNLIGINAYVALKYKWERMSLWLVTAQKFTRFEKDTKNDLREMVLSGEYPHEPWAGYVTTNYKKHGAFTAQVNTAGRAFWGFDEFVVDCSDIDAVNDHYSRLLAAKMAGIGNDTLENLVAAPITIKMCGVETWLDFESWARPRHQSPLYKFCRWLLPPMDKIKPRGKK